jgi:hypothetical protein
MQNNKYAWISHDTECWLSDAEEAKNDRYAPIYKRVRVVLVEELKQ